MVKRISLALLLVSLGANSPIKSYSHDEDVCGDMAKVGIIGGAIAASCYGIYQLGNWLFSKTDQQIVESALQAHNNAYTKYHTMLDILEGSYGNRSTHMINETLLYTLATAKLQDRYINSYISDLDYSLNRVRSELRAVNRRFEGLQQEAVYNNAAYQAASEFKEVALRMNYLIPRLEFLSQFLHYHKNYFVLYEQESDLYGRYDRELSVMNNGVDYQSRVYEIRKAIQTKFSNVRYPYLSYKDALDSDLRELDNNIRNVLYKYDERICAARQLASSLADIRELVIRDTYYQYDLQAKQNDEREQERREIEKRKMRALERQARAQEQQAYMQEYTVRELERQNQQRAWCAFHECHDCCTPCNSASITISVQN